MSNEVEQWKWIPGFEGDYEASTLGNIRSHKKGHIHLMKLKINPRSGYLFLILHKNNVPYTRTVHRLIAETFLPNPNNFPEVNHVNEDKTDNKVSNLEWCSTLHNCVHSKHKREKSVIVRSLDGEFLGEFKSQTAASEVLGVCKARITDAIKKHGHCSGLILEYGEKDKQWQYQ